MSNEVMDKVDTELDVFQVVGLSDYGPAVWFRINQDQVDLEMTADQAEIFGKQLIAQAEVARKLDAAENALV